MHSSIRSMARRLPILGALAVALLYGPAASARAGAI